MTIAELASKNRTGWPHAWFLITEHEVPLVALIFRGTAPTRPWWTIHSLMDDY